MWQINPNYDFRCGKQEISDMELFKVKWILIGCRCFSCSLAGEKNSTLKRIHNESELYSLGPYLCSVRSCCGVCRWWTRAVAPEPTRSRPARHRSTRWGWWRTSTHPDLWYSAPASGPAEEPLEQWKHPTQHKTQHLALICSRVSLTWWSQSQGFVGDAMLEQRIPLRTRSTCSSLHHYWYNWWECDEERNTTLFHFFICDVGENESLSESLERQSETEGNWTLFLTTCCYLHYFLR